MGRVNGGESMCIRVLSVGLYLYKEGPSNIR